MNRLDKLISPIRGKRIFLRELIQEDVTEIYAQWMNDPSVTQYLESRFADNSMENLVNYVNEKRADPNSVIFAIVLNSNLRHIGNIKLGPINWIHRRASVGIVIGETDCFGQGYATEAIGLIVDFAFGKIGLHKLTAGCYEPNLGAEKAFQNNGFSVEGIRKDHAICNGNYVDIFELGLIDPENSGYASTIK